MFRADEEWLNNYQKRMNSYKNNEKAFKLDFETKASNLSSKDKKSKYKAIKCEYERNKI